MKHLIIVCHRLFHRKRGHCNYWKKEDHSPNCFMFSKLGMKHLIIFWMGSNHNWWNASSC